MPTESISGRLAALAGSLKIAWHPKDDIGWEIDDEDQAWEFIDLLSRSRFYDYESEEPFKKRGKWWVNYIPYYSHNDREIFRLYDKAQRS